MHSTPRRASMVALMALLLGGVAGCYDRSANGDQSVYSFALWIGILVVLGGLIFMPAGWFLRRLSERFGWGLMIFSPILLIFVGPAMFSDKVVVDNDHFEARYGFWFAPSVHNIRFSDLQEIRHVGVRGNRNRISYQLHCVRHDGTTEVVSVGNLVRNAVDEILARAEAKRVRVVRQEP